MPLLQPGSRSPKIQARIALEAVAKANALVDQASELAGQAQDTATAAATASATALGVAAAANTSAGSALDQAGDAVTVATAAGTKAQTLYSFQQVRDSYTDPPNVVSSVLNSAGAAVITIADHQRRYLNGAASVAVAGGTVTGWPPNSAYTVRYTDTTFSGGAVAYEVVATVDQAIASLDAPARHLVGSGVTPQVGSTAPATGTGDANLPYWKRYEQTEQA